MRASEERPFPAKRVLNGTSEKAGVARPATQHDFWKLGNRVPGLPAKSAIFAALVDVLDEHRYLSSPPVPNDSESSLLNDPDLIERERQINEGYKGLAAHADDQVAKLAAGIELQAPLQRSCFRL